MIALNNLVTEDAVGYWHDIPLSIGRLFEDALALVWRSRRDIAPVVILLVIGWALIDFVEPVSSWLSAPAPVSALQSTPVMTHFPALTFAWNLFSMILLVAMTKVLYAAYHDHEAKRPHELHGLMRGFFRLIAASLCFAVIVLVGIIPLALLAGIAFGLSTLLGAIAKSVLLGCFSIVISASLGIYLVFGLMTGQYLSVGAVVRSDGIMRLLGDSVRIVFRPQLLRRTFLIGSGFLGIFAALWILSMLVVHVISSLVHTTDVNLVSDVFGNLVTAPIVSAFAVVFFTDAQSRLHPPQPVEPAP